MTLRLELRQELPVAAASGIACVGRKLFVVADDENRLAVIEDDGRVQLVAFAPERPAADPAARKREKRDVEALTVAEGTLLGLGSGSTERRRRGFAWAVSDSGDLLGEPEELDLTALYEELGKHLPDLNIEGATFKDERLLLFQRGNGPAGVNAVVRLRWHGSARASVVPEAIEAVELHELGSIAGVPLCFTDAACAGDEVVFTAVAEAGASTYHDGACVGAAVGILGRATVPLDPPLKVEGVEVTARDDDAIDLVLVVDDDDPGSAAQLLSARLSRVID